MQLYGFADLWYARESFFGTKNLKTDAAGFNNRVFFGFEGDCAF